MLTAIKHWIYNRYRQYVWLLSRIGKNVKAFPSDGNELYVITVAYDHVRLIEKQIELVKLRVKDKDYLHVVVDNSPNRKARKQIREICEREKVGYVPVPVFIDKLICHRLFGYGLSHGAALNWMYYHFLKQQKPKRFALIDHDAFPMEDYSFIDKLGKRDFYGVERVRGNGWYVWPGWCIFRFDAISECHPNFLPYFLKETFLDAGGGNYPRFYGRYDLSSVDFAPVVIKRIKRSEELSTHDDIYHGDCVQLIDNTWLHLINGSNYARIPGKKELVDKIIDNTDKLYENIREKKIINYVYLDYVCNYCCAAGGLGAGLLQGGRQV